ncbi:hypothetical protein EZV62_024983 [Acer yangbiense]|uniref:Uncharacterized protein n=1 Tax=Acer yangbiense TaxID=1000413 RepID=A0A5C7GWK2_9ROSI|nr:hypothetical protein EZV62_024983 [Acer yangbiense]
MLGLLISQPNSSQHNHPPPPPSITHHHNRNDDGGDDGDDDGSDGDGSLKVCKDCGNRAKKECSFRRCRTCCKTRGFDCATHERSTWIPASKRRDKRIGSGSGSGCCSSYGGVKRPRTFVPSPSSHINVTNSSSSANDFSLGLSSYTQDSRFKKRLPRRIEARAVFRNIRVTDVSDGEAENAYVATVNISGHVFRGLLYDHGTGTHRDHNNNNNNNNNVFPCVTKLHKETSTSGRGRRNRDSSSTIVDPLNTNTFTAASSGN